MSHLEEQLERVQQERYRRVQWRHLGGVFFLQLLHPHIKTACDSSVQTRERHRYTDHEY